MCVICMREKYVVSYVTKGLVIHYSGWIPGEVVCLYTLRHLKNSKYPDTLQQRWSLITLAPNIHKLRNEGEIA